MTNNGPLVQQLEAELSGALSGAQVQFMSNGTIALQVAIKALGLIGEIITTPFSYVATTTAILWEGCEPVFVDIEERTFCIDATKIEAAITPRTSAILATHVYGYPCDVLAIEEIARRHHFEPKAINQIKTALLEACVNAAEHSLSPDRKIYQKFTVEADKIIITISNRGLRLTDAKGEEFEPVEGRRGWGLKLMQSLMDEVKFEQVDDGTRISMTKYLKK